MTDKGKEHENKKQEQKKQQDVTISAEEFNKLQAALKEKEELKDKYLRLAAEIDNTRKRLEKDKQEFIRFANEAIILRLLNVLDGLERSIELAQSKHQDLPTFLKGIELILAQLYELLKEHGVEPVEAEGGPFDPNFHEALMQVEDKDLPEHTVVEELQKGYLLNGRVVRTAKVKVSKK